MQAQGKLVEIGTLEDEGGLTGAVIERDDGSYVTIKGLTPDEARAVAKHLFTTVTLKLN